VVDQRLRSLGLPVRYGSRNPFGFMDLQDVQGLANMFERTVSEYQQGATGSVVLDGEF
jgi:ribonucleoside-diphosphate reductase beta chain